MDTYDEVIAATPARVYTKLAADSGFDPLAEREQRLAAFAAQQREWAEAVAALAEAEIHAAAEVEAAQVLAAAQAEAEAIAAAQAEAEAIAAAEAAEVEAASEVLSADLTPLPELPVEGAEALLGDEPATEEFTVVQPGDDQVVAEPVAPSLALAFPGLPAVPADAPVDLPFSPVAPVVAPAWAAALEDEIDGDFVLPALPVPIPAPPVDDSATAEPVVLAEGPMEDELLTAHPVETTLVDEPVTVESLPQTQASYAADQVELAALPTEPAVDVIPPFYGVIEAPEFPPTTLDPVLTTPDYPAEVAPLLLGEPGGGKTPAGDYVPPVPVEGPFGMNEVPLVDAVPDAPVLPVTEALPGASDSDPTACDKTREDLAAYFATPPKPQQD